MIDKREELIQRLEAARTVLHELLAQIPVETEIYPGWTLRQFYAHLTGWDDVVTATLKAHAAGQTPATPAVKGIDAYNAESVATRSTLDYDHIVREWHLARAQLKAALRELPLEKLDEPVLYPWGPTDSVERMVGVLIWHEGEEHAAELRTWLEKQATA
jgi:Mycothiol maleylpyruvate isomerase N-terminal domain